MTLILKNLMHKVTNLTRAGRLNEATAVIQRALAGASSRASPPPGAAPEAAGARPRAARQGRVFDMERASIANAGAGLRADGEHAPAGDAGNLEPRSRARADRDAGRHGGAQGQAQWLAGSHAEGAETRAYKLFVPPALSGRARPLLVMLHGCTQDPDDFAAGTGMNRQALELDFLVLYPAQPRSANPNRCWNWFRPEHQRRGEGEPALVASMARWVASAYGADPQRIYVAGLSAGGAMAALLADVYPDLFAAVGVHSGLPSGAAHNAMAALAVMRSGAAAAPRNGVGKAGSANFGANSVHPPLPLIVFHGEADATVHPRNGEALVAAALRDNIKEIAEAADGADLASPRIEQGASSPGRTFTRSVHVGRGGEVLAEHWLIHGAGHAWSGGNAAGSYTDPAGPDATREMLRFFLQHPRRGTA